MKLLTIAAVLGGLVCSSLFAEVEVFSELIIRPQNFEFELPPIQRTKPILVGEILYYVTREGEVGALHKEQNYKLWETKLPKTAAMINGAFAYGRTKLFIGDVGGNLYALNARDGSLAWQTHVNSPLLSPPVVSRDKVFVLNSGDELYAFSEADGAEKWRYVARKSDSTKMTVDGTSTPVVYGSEVYVGFSDGYLVCLSANNGQMIWLDKLRTQRQLYDIDMQPLVDEKMVLAATFDGNLYAIDRLQGKTLWMLKVGSYGDFTLEDQKVYFSGLNGNFYAIEQSNGSIVWKTPYDISAGVGLQPVRVQNYLVAATTGDPTYILNPKDGKIEDKVYLGAGTHSSPVTGNGENRFYLMSNYGNLFSFVLRNNPFSEKKGPETLALPSAISRAANSFKNPS